ncbi:hypothetical protein M0R45_004703 [Rubus argutus]|uniref:Pentatricopeptide repeat-containing protein n=1 Tax=Rubus argutus TaxID=59490 RepID=A0AAW1YKL8_RUBAR
MNQLSWTFHSFHNFLKTCIAERDLFTGEALHALYFKSLIPSSTYIYNHFILLYSKCGRLSSAWNAFDHTQDPNVFSFNAIIAAYAKESQTRIAHQLFHEIPAYAERGETEQPLGLFTGMRDGFTISAVIRSCCDDIGLIRQLHSLIVLEGFDSYVSVNNALLTYYSKNGFLPSWRRRSVFSMSREK